MPARAPSRPTMPAYFAADPAMAPARLVWEENIDRVAAAGRTEADSDLFARYCCEEGAYRQAIKRHYAGDPAAGPVSGGRLDALATMATLLGLAGNDSRSLFGRG